MYGDSAVGRKRVAELREQGGDVRALAARLVSQAESVPWHGKAAEAMRERIRERASHLRAAAAQHDTAAESLAAHLVEDARTRASEGAVDDGADAALLAFDPPPAGHRDWLTVELPGL